MRRAYPVEVQLFLLMFIPRREIRSISSKGSIEVSFHLLNFGVGKVYWISKTNKVYRVLFLLKMFYPPEGVCSQTPKGSNWTLFPFYWVRKSILDFKNLRVYRVFFCAKMFYCDGWTDGQPDGQPDGRKDGRSIKRVLQFFFILRYIKHFIYVNFKFFVSRLRPLLCPPKTAHCFGSIFFGAFLLKFERVV